MSDEDKRNIMIAEDEYNVALRERRQRLITAEEFAETKRAYDQAKKKSLVKNP